MPKKKSKSHGHQSFKLTPHGHPQERVLLYVVTAAVVGAVVGYLFREQVIDVLGAATSIY